MPTDDRELARRAAEGDQAAFAQLMERAPHRRWMYGLAWRVVPHEEDALDVTQEAMAKVARCIGQFRGDGSFRGWLGTLVTRREPLKIQSRRFCGFEQLFFNMIRPL